MFAPYQDVVLGIGGLIMALAALQLGAWAIRASVQASADVGGYGE